MTLYMRDQENKELGSYIKTVSQIRRKKDKFDEDNLADLYDIDKLSCCKIIFYIDKYPDMDDEDIADKLLNDDEE